MNCGKTSRQPGGTQINKQRRAEQHATRAAFFILGFAVSAWAPVIPFVKTRAGLNDATLGLVLLCLGVGSLVALPLAGALTARLGCRKVLIAALLLICPILPALSLVQSDRAARRHCCSSLVRRWVPSTAR